MAIGAEDSAVAAAISLTPPSDNTVAPDGLDNSLGLPGTPGAGPVEADESSQWLVDTVPRMKGNFPADEKLLRA